MIILTDLSDVLIGGLGDAAKIIAARYGESSGRKCWQRISETKEEFDEVLRGNLSERDYYRIFFTGGNFCFGYNDIGRIFSEAFQATIPGTLKLYQRVTSYPERFGNDVPMVKGMPDIYIVSDHIRERKKEIMKLHPEIFRVVREVFWSCDLGAIKSDHGFFYRLLYLLDDVDPGEVIFIDDNTKNVEAARRAGITSVQFVDATSLERELGELGFVIAPPTP